MAKTLKDLAKWARTKAESIEEGASRVAVASAVAAVRHLAYITPVDTSEHLSNWQVSLGRRASAAIAPHFAGRKGSTRRVSAEETVSIARLSLVAKKPGQPIFISNLGPVIGMLDEGWSNQFPGGFIPAARIVISVAAQAEAKKVFYGK